MKKIIWLGLGLLLLLAAGSIWLAGCKGKKNSPAAEVRTKEVYTCPMHPEIVRDKPGNCPICGMILEKKVVAETLAVAAEKPSGAQKDDYTCSMHPAVSSDKPGACPVCGMVLEKRSGLFASSAQTAEQKFQLTLPGDKQALANVATTKAEHRRLERSVVTVGTVDYSEQRLYHVPTRVPGRIEKLFVDFTGAYIEKGEPLFIIYSPELVMAQKEYLLQLPQKGMLGQSVDTSFRQASREKLLLWGITPEQMTTIESGDSTYTRLTIYSPRSGIVVARNKLAGSYVAEGESVYDIADLSIIWVWAEIYEYEIAGVAVGTRVSVASPAYPGKKFSGRLSFISPEVNRESRTIRVRAELENPELLLKPGMYVDVQVKIPTAREVLAIPATAVLQTGNRQVVWVKVGPTTFEPRAVTLGIRGGDWWEVLSGISHGEEVVSSGGYLLDSEAQFRLGKPAAGHTGHSTMKMEDKSKNQSNGMKGMQMP